MDIEFSILNCFLLLIPVIIWNILFYKHLPESYSKGIFWKDIPPYIQRSETILRGIVFVLPIFMPLHANSWLQKVGLVVYMAGLLIYFLSWILQMLNPQSKWSMCIWGYMAPAYTSLIWLTGICLAGTGNNPFITISYACASILFVISHCTHTAIIYKRQTEKEPY